MVANSLDSWTFQFRIKTGSYVGRVVVFMRCNHGTAVGKNINLQMSCNHGVALAKKMKNCMRAATMELHSKKEKLEVQFDCI